MRFAKNNDVLGTTNRGNPAESGLCTLCRADCMGQCETWKSSLVGRKLLYPRDFGVVTSGANNTTTAWPGDLPTTPTTASSPMST